MIDELKRLLPAGRIEHIARLRPEQVAHETRCFARTGYAVFHHGVPLGHIELCTRDYEAFDPKGESIGAHETRIRAAGALLVHACKRIAG